MRTHLALAYCCMSIALCPLLAQSLSDQLDCACATSRATYAEDLALLPTLLRNSPTHRAGTFVEIGALDGFTFSNTLMLERCFGWRGVLIEANPLNFAKLNASGRPSVKVQSAVCAADKDPSVVEFTVDGGPVAGQVGQLTRGHQHLWSHWNRAKGTMNVSCAPLQTILRRAGYDERSEFDLLSLDVEGAEALVLSTVSTAMFKAVLIELDGTDKNKDEQARKLLHAGGLRQAKHLRVTNSEVFLREGELEVGQPNHSMPNIAHSRSHSKVTPAQLESVIAGG